MFRAYSISGFDPAAGILRVTIRLVEKGFGSEVIRNEFDLNKEFLLEGPMGEELIVDPAAQKCILIGGGIGITPFLPIVDELLNQTDPPEIILAQGAANPQELYYAEYFAQLAKKHPRFTYIPAVERGDSQWSGITGNILTALDQADITDSNVYICGSGGMVRALRHYLNNRGLEDDLIKAESA